MSSSCKIHPLAAAKNRATFYQSKLSIVATWWIYAEIRRPVKRFVTLVSGFIACLAPNDVLGSPSWWRTVVSLFSLFSARPRALQSSRGRLVKSDIYTANGPKNYQRKLYIGQQQRKETLVVFSVAFQYHVSPMEKQNLPFLYLALPF